MRSVEIGLLVAAAAKRSASSFTTRFELHSRIERYHVVTLIWLDDAARLA